jgi:putative ABC transport system permease protein
MYGSDREEDQLSEADATIRGSSRPLWAKAPLGLLRYPGLLTSVLVGALLLSLVAAAYPVFLSRSEGALLATEIADPTISPYGAGMFYGATNVRLGETAPDSDALLMDELDTRFKELAARGPHLGPTVSYVIGPQADATLPGGVESESGPVKGRLVYATDAGRHVDVIAGTPGDGALVPDEIADTLGVGPGDEIELVDHGETNRIVPLEVGAVYQSLYSQPLSGYWSPWREQIYRQCPDCAAPPQFILVDRDDLLGYSRELRQTDVDLGFSAPVTDLPLTLDEAREVRRYTTAVKNEVSHRRTELGRLFECCGRIWGRTFFFVGARDTEFRSAAPFVIREAERRTATVEGPLRLLLIAGLGVAAAVVAAAAAFAVAGRHTEAALLHARGWGPLRFSAKSIVEALIPTAIGAVVGLLLGSWLVATFGPAAPASASAFTTSYRGAASAAVAALVVLGVVSGVSFIRTFEVHSLKRRFAWIPWELVAIAGSIWVLSRLRGGGALIPDPRLDIVRPSALLLVFPVLFVAGIATFGARLAVEGLRRVGSRFGEGSPASYLALHRITGLPRLTAMLVGAAALCLGIFVNGQTMVRSLRATVDAKAEVFVGSDVQVLIDYDAPPQESFPFPITRATRVKYAGALQPGEVPFDMVGIDPDTIAGAAFWDSSFSDRSLADLVADLDSKEGAIPAVLVQGSEDLEPTSMQIGRDEAPIRIVGRASAFPGVSSDDPVLVVNADNLEERLGAGRNPLRSPRGRTEFWIKGDPDRVMASLEQLEAFPLATVTAREVKDVPFIKAAIESFSMLNVLGLAAALLVVGVLVVYLQARQRARAVSNVLSLRMGMRDRQAMLALVMELGLILLAAYLLGSVLGIIGGLLVAPMLDPLQTIPPAPLFAAPTMVVAFTAVGLALVAGVGGWIVHRRASSVDLGEVLRVAE